MQRSDESTLAKSVQDVVNAHGQSILRPEQEQQRILQLQRMAAPELRAREIDNQLSPELRSQEMDYHIAQTQHSVEQSIRDAERALNHDINRRITEQTDAINHQIYAMERHMAQAERAIRDTELSMTRQAQAGRLQFGMYGQPPRVVSAPPVQPATPQRRPFTDEEYNLVSAYLEKLYNTSGSDVEKRAIDKLRDPIHATIMRIPVFLIPDGRTYDYATLQKMMADGISTCPETRRPFTLNDIKPDFGVISAIQEFLEDAIRAKNAENAAKCCKP